MPYFVLLVATGWFVLLGQHVTTSDSVHNHSGSGVFSMWALMTLVMMSTTVVPILRSLNDITSNGSQTIWWAFVAAYSIVWLGFSLVASSMQVLLAELDLLDSHNRLNQLLSGGLLVTAGLYQFSSLKERCQSECVAPMQFFLRHWREGISGGFKMGLRHGVTCVGCCWALMLLAFVGGLTNIWFMVFSAAVMAIEKFPMVGRKLTIPLGVLITLWGVVVLAGLLNGVGTTHNHIYP
jgi:predicted metal-binding membrane protein